METPKLFIGLDVHKKTWTADIRTELSHHKTFSQPADPMQLEAYVDKNFPEYEHYHTFLSIFLLILIFIQIPISYYNFLNNIIYLINKDICEDFYILHIIMIIILSILISIPLVFSIGVKVKAHQNHKILLVAKTNFNAYFHYKNFTINDLKMKSLENYIIEKTKEPELNQNIYNINSNLRSKEQINKNIAFTLYAFLNFNENIYKCILELFWKKNKVYFLISLIFGLVFNTLGFFKNRVIKIFSIVFNTFILIFLTILLFQYYSLRNIVFINNKTRYEMESALIELQQKN